MFNTRTGSSNKFIFLSQKCQIPKIEIRPCFNTLGPKFIFRPKIRGFIVKSCHLNYLKVKTRYNILNFPALFSTVRPAILSTAIAEKSAGKFKMLYRVFS